MRVLVDADGCPVIGVTVDLCKKQSISCILLCDTSHSMEKYGVETVVVSKGADSVDFALVNMLKKGDIVVTQDYGLAAMAMAKQAIPLSQDGFVYDETNIEALLLVRHTAKKIRNGGGRLKGNKKRIPQQDVDFKRKLAELLS
ncbi:MAG: DUF188 domain-containing protein [Eubacteriales bacterium]